MSENDDDKISSEGGDPPNKVHRAKRVRKLSGPAAQALGELAFRLYDVAAANVPSDTKWKLLQAKLLAWRAAYLP